MSPRPGPVGTNEKCVTERAARADSGKEERAPADCMGLCTQQVPSGRARMEVKLANSDGAKAGWEASDTLSLLSHMPAVIMGWKQAKRRTICQ